MHAERLARQIHSRSAEDETRQAAHSGAAIAVDALREHRQRMIVEGHENGDLVFCDSIGGALADGVPIRIVVAETPWDIRERRSQWTLTRMCCRLRNVCPRRRWMGCLGEHAVTRHATADDEIMNLVDLV